MYKYGLAILVVLTSLGFLIPGAAALDDPMRPPTGVTATEHTPPATRFVLDSTLIAPGRRNAVINGHNVSVGDTVDGARVLAIEPAQVRLQHHERQLILQLLPVTVKQPRTIE